MKIKQIKKITVPLKHLSNFWRSLDISLFNCKVSLPLTWSKDCIILSKAKRDVVAATELSAANVSNVVPGVDVSATNATFKITDIKQYVPVVTLSTEDDDFLEQLKSGFKRTIKWNKYRSEMTNQTKTNNLNYLIDPTFNEVNRLFVLSFENEEDRTSFSKYYTPKVEIKGLNVLIDGESFFDVPVKNKEEGYGKIIELSKK